MKSEKQSNHQTMFIVIALLFVGVFFRFYQLDTRMQFTWDQIQNAWVMKDILVDHKLPLLGMVAKGNSGFHIGPAYYYLLAPFYYITNLDPIAAGLFVGVVALITMGVLYIVTRRILGQRAALLALSFYVISIHAIGFDRIPWPVSLIPLVSTLIFYFLYNVISGDPTSLVGLALSMGFAFHIHFTAVYYLLIVIAVLPLFPWRKEIIKYILLSLILFGVWFIPMIISEMQTKYNGESNLVKYVDVYYHGFHMVRVLQLMGDAFIEYESLLYFHVLKVLKYIFLPVFSFLYFKGHTKKESVRLFCLVAAWFLVPWVVMSVYSGEISNYYFESTRTVAIMTMAYIVERILRNSNKAIHYATIVIIAIFYIGNIAEFFQHPTQGGLTEVRSETKQAVQQGVIIPFKEGDPKSYFYFLYAEKPKIFK